MEARVMQSLKDVQMRDTSATEAPCLGLRLEQLEKHICQNGELVNRLAEMLEAQVPITGEALNRGPEPPPTLAERHIKNIDRLMSRLEEQRAALGALAAVVERLR